MLNKVLLVQYWSVEVSDKTEKTYEPDPTCTTITLPAAVSSSIACVTPGTSVMYAYHVGVGLTHQSPQIVPGYERSSRAVPFTLALFKRCSMYATPFE